MRPWCALLGSLVLALVGAGCVGTPIPQPPALDPPDADLIRHEDFGTFAQLVGEAGAVVPGATLWAMNLDGTLDPETTVAEADGSFMLSFFAIPGHEVRVQARDGDDRSRPVDLLVPRGEVVRATEGCLALEPALEVRLAAAVAVGASETRVVRVSNRCAGEAVFDVALRRPSDAWRVVTPGPFSVPSGGAADVEVAFAPLSAGLHEEIVFLALSAPALDRRPITLSGEGR